MNRTKHFYDIGVAGNIIFLKFTFEVDFEKF